MAIIASSYNGESELHPPLGLRNHNKQRECLPRREHGNPALYSAWIRRFTIRSRAIPIRGRKSTAAKNPPVERSGILPLRQQSGRMSPSGSGAGDVPVFRHQSRLRARTAFHLFQRLCAAPLTMSSQLNSRRNTCVLSREEHL